MPWYRARDGWLIGDTQPTLTTSSTGSVYYTWATTTSSTTSTTLSGTGGIYWREIITMGEPWPDYEHQEAMARYGTRRRFEAELARANAPPPPRMPASPAIISAQNRARELLLSHLNEGQRATFEANDWFVVVGGKSKTSYRINGRSYAGNVGLLNSEGKAIAQLCAHCDHSIPLADQLLAQKIRLECDEDYFLGLANRRALAS